MGGRGAKNGAVIFSYYRKHNIKAQPKQTTTAKPAIAIRQISF
jgi:hypothetical protein